MVNLIKFQFKATQPIFLANELNNPGQQWVWCCVSAWMRCASLYGPEFKPCLCLGAPAMRSVRRLVPGSTWKSPNAVLKAFETLFCVCVIGFIYFLPIERVELVKLPDKKRDPFVLTATRGFDEQLNARRPPIDWCSVGSFAPLQQYAIYQKASGRK